MAELRGFWAVLSPYLECFNPYLECFNPFLESLNPYLECFRPFLEYFGPFLEFEGMIFNPFLESFDPYLECFNPFSECFDPFLEFFSPHLESSTFFLECDEKRTIWVVRRLICEIIWHWCMDCLLFCYFKIVIWKFKILFVPCNMWDNEANRKMPVHWKGTI